MTWTFEPQPDGTTDCGKKRAKSSRERGENVKSDAK
jgi:hypothetical protein